MAQRIFRWLS